MTTFLVISATVLSLYGLENHWFDTRMHYYHNTYQSKQECQDARKAITDKKKGSVCTDKHDLYVTK